MFEACCVRVCSQLIGETRIPVGLHNFGGSGPEWFSINDNCSLLLKVACDACSTPIESLSSACHAFNIVTALGVIEVELNAKSISTTNPPRIDIDLQGDRYTFHPNGKGRSCFVWLDAVSWRWPPCSCCLSAEPL